MATWQYRAHETGTSPRMRIRRPEWSPDSFIVVEHNEFKVFQKLMSDMNFGPGEDLDETEPE